MSQQYKIKGTDGAEYGPVSTEELDYLSATALLPCNHPGRHRAEEGEEKSQGQGNLPCLDRDFVRFIFLLLSIVIGVFVSTGMLS